MPIYEYLCEEGHRTEEVRSLSEFTEVIACPECRKQKIAAKTDGRVRKAKLVPSMTGTPILKAGRGGFYKPTRPERDPNA